MATPRKNITIVGAGLAGCEAGVQLAERGFDVTLCEQKPVARSAAHVSDHFAELVCSNSLRSSNAKNAVGLLKEEMLALDSVVMRVAAACRVPAGDAFAVDRERFARAMSALVEAHPRITVRPGRVDEVPPASDGPVILATGPLTADGLAASLAALTGETSLYFYDAMAPIIAGDSIDRSVVFAASRWGKGEGADYLNCPLDAAQYDAVMAHLLSADVYPAREFEVPQYFPGCQPIEVIAHSGHDALRFGPLKPTGLDDPRTGRWPHAVVQLRKEDADGQAYNLVGLQTKLRRGAQKALLQLIPGLQRAEILRFGALHRNTYLDAPRHLDARFALRAAPHVHLAGQITGVEGYVESAATGLLVALSVAHAHAHDAATPFVSPPGDTALGALARHVRGEAKLDKRPYEPQNVHWGLFCPMPASAATAPAARMSKQDHKAARLEHARASFAQWLRLVQQPARVPPHVDVRAAPAPLHAFA